MNSDAQGVLKRRPLKFEGANLDIEFMKPHPLVLVQHGPVEENKVIFHNYYRYSYYCRSGMYIKLIKPIQYETASKLELFTVTYKTLCVAYFWQHHRLFHRYLSISMVVRMMLSWD